MSDEELLAAYRATVWTLRLPGGSARLRLSDPPVSLPALYSTGIVTAYNPASEARSAAENEAANRRLEARLQAAGARYHPAEAGGTGADAERWREPGFLVVGQTRAELVALGEEFGQNAIVWIDSEGFPSLVVTRRGFCDRTPGDVV